MSSGAGAAPPEARDAIELVVVGAHLRGMPLNHQLMALGAVFVGEAATAPEYRLYALPGGEPRKPGLLRVAAGAGRKIAVEVWRLAPASFGAFVSAIPSPLGVGKIRLADGRVASGFLVEAVAVEGAEDITDHGGWRAYRERFGPAA